MNEDQIIHKISEEIISFINSKSIPVAISNRHIHITEDTKRILFGNKPLTVKKWLKQPGQFATEETVKLVGPKNEINDVRIVGPTRKYNQVELSVSDCYLLGVTPVIRDSGNHDDTEGICIVGPKGITQIEKGVIVAQRHIHMTESDARNFGVHDMQVVRIRYSSGNRKGILGDVLVRVNDEYYLECHLDIEEANALGIKNNELVGLEFGGI